MKKLLLYLVAIITLGTMSVDALAATKPVYIEKPSGKTECHLWWWGGTTMAANWFDYDGNNGKPKPNLFADETRKLIIVSEVTGNDKKNYFKVEIDEGTTNLRIDKNYENGTASTIWSTVYNYNSSANKYEPGAKVSEIIPSVWIGGDNFGWGNTKNENLFEDKGNGIYEKTVTIGSGNFFSVYFGTTKTNDLKQYNIVTNNTKLKLPINNESLSPNSQGMKFDESSDFTVKITVDFSNTNSPKISMVEAEPYDYALKGSWQWNNNNEVRYLKDEDGDGIWTLNYTFDKEYEFGVIKLNGGTTNEADFFNGTNGSSITFDQPTSLKKGGTNLKLSAGTYYFAYDPKAKTLTVKDKSPQPCQVTVYFVNRGGWEEPIRCFNWTDVNGDDNFKYNNGKNFDNRENMTKLEGNDDLKKQILGENYDKTDWKNHIWTFTLNNKYKEDGTLLRPKVIFSAKEGGKIDIDQTRNLFVVANGIYTNSAGSAESDVKASELLPARIVVLDDKGNKEVEVYPNTFHNTKYSTIYTSDPKFLAWAKQWTDDSSKEGYTKRIGIQLTYQKDGQSFTCTGDPGTTTMVKTVINGKEFLRLDIAEDVIPDQTKLEHLIIWEEKGIGSYGKIKLESDGSITVSDNPGVTHNLGNDPEGTEYQENGTDQTLNGKHHGDSKDHHKCFFSDCPLVFTNVYFRNGFVYNRDGIHSILEDVKPDALYIVSRGDGTNHEFTLDGYPGRILTVDEVFENKQAYRINATELLGKPQYVIPDVPYTAYFSFVGLFNNYTEGDGTVTAEKLIPFAFPFTTTEVNKALYPGKPEAISADKKGYYSIERNGQQYKEYDVTVDWLTPSVSIAPAKQDANFSLVYPNDNGFTRAQNGYLLMYAMGNKEYPFKEGTTNVIKYKDEQGNDCAKTEANDLRYRLCTVTYDENIPNENENYFNNVKVSMTRTNDYEKYFRNGLDKINLPALVRSSVQGEGYVREGIALHRNYETNYADIYLRAHTAGVAIVRINQDKPVVVNTKKDGDVTYAATQYAFPVRILPTPSSIGLELNGKGIYAVDYKGDLDPESGVTPEYTYYVEEGDFTPKDGTKNWSHKRIKMEPNGCAYEVEDNDGQKIKTVELYWAYEMPAEEEEEPTTRSVVARTTSALTAYDVHYPLVLKEHFSRFHAIDASKLDENHPVYLQIVHNGVVSPVYTVKVLATTDSDLLTDVEEVEVADEVESVYYNLNGVRVNGENLAKGIYVKVTGNKTEKIFVK